MFGTAVSLAAHVSVVAGVVSGDVAARASDAGRAAPARAVREQVHWVGLGDGPGEGGGPARGRPDALPPLAYVIPGREGGPVRVVGRAGPRTRSGRGGGREAAAPAPERALPSPERARRSAPAVLAALPDVALPDPSATLLVAGVVASSTDLARRVTRPEDFAPGPASESLTAIVARAVVAMTQSADAPGTRAVPIPLVSNAPPRYPAELERAQVGGRVLVEFTVDSTGAIDAGSLRVLQSTHALFTEAVRSALPRLRFLPALRDEQAVGVTVRQPFHFTVRGVRGVRGVR